MCTFENTKTGRRRGLRKRLLPSAFAAGAGIDRSHLLIFGLADDEIGYIIPPGDFLLDETLPYFQEATDAAGRKHYEETNSLDITTAYEIAEAFETAIGKLN